MVPGSLAGDLMPKLPNVEDAVVEDRTLDDDLLDEQHPSGGPKARFLTSFGFALDQPGAVRSALLQHAREHDVSDSRETTFGTIFEIDGQLTSPDGRHPAVRTVWAIDHGASAPRLITLVPRARQGGDP